MFATQLPEVGTLSSMADYFGVTTDYLLGKTNIKEHFVANNLKDESNIFIDDIADWLKTEDCKEYVDFIYKAYKQGITKEMLKKANISIKIS